MHMADAMEQPNSPCQSLMKSGGGGTGEAQLNQAPLTSPPTPRLPFTPPVLDQLKPTCVKGKGSNFTQSTAVTTSGDLYTEFYHSY